MQEEICVCFVLVLGPPWRHQDLRASCYNLRGILKSFLDFLRHTEEENWETAPSPEADIKELIRRFEMLNLQGPETAPEGWPVNKELDICAIEKHHE